MKFLFLTILIIVSNLSSIAQNNCEEIINSIILEVSNEGPYCAGEPIVLTGSGSSTIRSINDLKYIWSGPDGYTSTEQNPKNANSSGIYSLSIEANSCLTNPVNTEVEIVEGEDLLYAEASNTGPYCDGDEIILTGTGSSILNRPIQLMWSGPNGYQSNSFIPTGITDAGTYQLTASIENCTSTVAKTEVIFQQLEGSINGPDLVEIGDSIALQFTLTGAELFQITFAQEGELPITINNIKNGQQIKIAPQQSGAYQILDIQDMEGNNCNFKVGAPHQVFVKRKKESNVYFPNVFSPNNDGINDIFLPFANEEVEEVKFFRIFNRWGNLIFEQKNFPPNDLSFGWNGTYNGEVLDDNIFVYISSVKLSSGKEETIAGDVALIRNN